jgi:hypothetical protein
MSLHAAKGLEFDMVLLAGMEENIIPSTRSLDSDDAVEEERRLFYVGITRAREYLMLTHTKYRYTYGKMVDQFSSRFLDEVPAKLAQRHDLSYISQALFRSFFADWLNTHNNSGSNSPTSARSGADSAQDTVFTFSQLKQPVAHAASQESPYSAKNFASSRSTTSRHSSSSANPASGMSSTRARSEQSSGTASPFSKTNSGAPRYSNQMAGKPGSRTTISGTSRLNAKPTSVAQKALHKSVGYSTTARTASSFGKPAPSSLSNSARLNTPEIKPESSSNSVWRKNQPVQHAKYGLGIVEFCEEKGADTYVTVRFKAGVKKIMASFLQLV